MPGPQFWNFLLDARVGRSTQLLGPRLGSQEEVPGASLNSLLQMRQGKGAGRSVGWAKGSLSTPGPRPAPRPPSQSRFWPIQAPRGAPSRETPYPCPVLQPPPHLQTQGMAAVRIRHRQELRPLGAPERGRGREPEPKGDPTEPEGQPSPDRDNFQVPWSSPPIGRLEGDDGAARGTSRAGGRVRTECPGLRCQRLLPGLGMRRILSVWGSSFSAAPLQLGLDHLLPAWA